MTKERDLTKLGFRKLYHITLEEVARDTGLSVDYLDRIERGEITNIGDTKEERKLEKYIRKLDARTKKTRARF